MISIIYYCTNRAPLLSRFVSRRADARRTPFKKEFNKIGGHRTCVAIALTRTAVCTRSPEPGRPPLYEPDRTPVDLREVRIATSVGVDESCAGGNSVLAARRRTDRRKTAAARGLVARCILGLS